MLYDTFPSNLITYSTIAIHHENGHKYELFNSLDHLWLNYEQIKYGHEVIVGNRPQKLRFDIDATPDQISLEELEAFVRLVVAETINHYYNYYFARSLAECEEKDFLVTRSFGPSKFGVHVIAPFYMRSCSDAAVFAQAILGALTPKSKFVDLLDMNVYKTTQNLRLYGSAKMEDKSRIKVAWNLFGRTWTDMEARRFALIGHYAQEEIDIEPFLTVSCDENDPIKGETFFVNKTKSAGLSPDFECFNEYDEALRAIIAPYIGDSFIFRGRTETLLMYNRIAPSFCELCNVTHEKDNTMYFTIGPSDSKPVYMRCIRQDKRMCEKKDKKTKIIGHLGSVNVGNHIAHLIEEPVPEHDPILTKSSKFDILQYDEPRMRPFELRATQFVRAPMKMGKTKTMMEYIKTYFAKSTIYVITFRQTFSKAIERNFADHGITGFRSYQDIDKRSITMADAARLIIQVESLSRIQMGGNDPPHLLILDESESIIEQFMSGNVRDLGCAFGVFEWLIKYSPFFLALDANMCERTTDLICAMRTARTLDVHKRDYPPVSNYERYNLVCNTYKNATADHYRIIKTKKTWLALLIDYIKRGAKVAVFTNSLMDAKVINEALGKNFPQLKKQIYSSETSMPLKSEHFSDVHKYWIQFDVIICTPTVSAGISFELPHFDCVFGLFTDQSCSVETSRQMIGRVRPVRDFFVHFNYSVKHFPEEMSDIYCLLSSRRSIIDHQLAENISIPISYDLNGTPKLEQSPFVLMTMLNIRLANLSRNKFVARFIRQVKQIGAKITYHDDDLHCSIDQTALKTEINDRAAELIVKAPDISIEEYTSLTQKIEQGKATDADIVTVERYNIRETYSIAPDECTKQFVKDYGPKRDREIFKNVKTMSTAQEGIDPYTICSFMKPASKNGDPISDVILAKMTQYEKHLVATKIIKAFGASDVFNFAYSISEDSFTRFLDENRREFLDIFRIYGIYFNLKTTAREADMTNKLMIENLNTILGIYGAKFKKIKGVYFISRELKYDKLIFGKKDI